MQRFVIILSLFALAACQGVDEYVPCAGDSALHGRLCREVRSIAEEPVGQIEVSYPTQRTIEKAYRSVSGHVVRTTTEVYESGRLQSVTQDTDGGVKRALYEYDTTDSLRTVSHFTGIYLDSTVVIDYQFGRRVRETVEGKGSRVYEYYDDGQGPLYRLIERDSHGATLRYSQYEYFGTGQTRIEHRNADHTTDGHTLLVQDKDGRLLHSTRFDAEGHQLWATGYSYGTDGQLARSLTQGNGPTTSSDFLYY